MGDIYIYGLNTVKSALDSGKVKKVILQKDSKALSLIDTLKKNHIAYKIESKDLLNKLSKNGNHQGVCALIEEYKTISLEEFLRKNSAKPQSIVIMLDEIEDPHNLGAILRIADAFSVDAVIFKNKHQVGLTETVAKVSTGAINFVDCVEVSNLVNTIKELKKNGYWIYATDMDSASDYDKVSYADKSVIIVGSEGFGIARLTRENSDVIVKIPMYGHVNSLNASTACAIVVSQVAQQLKK